VSVCPKCRERKGKRSCPALGAPICSVCCGTHRQREIPCPDDCPHLASGERFQGGKRVRRGMQRGRGYLASRSAAFPDRHDFAFALAVEARAFRFLECRPEATDGDVRRALEAVRGALGPVVVPTERSELANGLLHEMKEHPEFRAFGHLGEDRRRRVLGRLLRFLSPDGSGGAGRAYFESVRGYFEEVLVEERRGPDRPRDAGGAEGERRSEGGIILP